MSIWEIGAYLSVITGVCFSGFFAYLTMADMRKDVKEVRQMYIEEHQAVMKLIDSHNSK